MTGPRALRAGRQVRYFAGFLPALIVVAWERLTGRRYR